MQFFYNYNEEIPEQFYFSDSHKIPTNCSVCGNEFGNQHYFIEKAFIRTHDKSKYQSSFEYVICERCKVDMMKSISKESLQNIQKFAMNMGGTPQFQDANNTKIDLEFMLTHCIHSGKSIEELEEYHLVGIFKEGKLVQLPMVYGESFIEEYSEILSEETKDFFDDFFNHITVLPPTFAKLLEDEKPRRPVLI